MKKETKTETFIYEGLGFPIRLVNVPLKKIVGEWAIDINFNLLQKYVFQMLAIKPTSLTGNELRFIIGYLGMPVREFANLFEVSHGAVLKWLKEESKMNPNSEFCLRLYILDYLHVTDKEFRKFYLKIREKSQIGLAEGGNPMEIDAKKIAC